MEKIFAITTQLATELTGKPRYRPEIKWAKKSWTHNVFRLFELIFGRQVGVRAESMSGMAKDKNGKFIQFYECYTWEATFAHLETILRGCIPVFKVVHIHIPVFALPGALIRGESLKIPYVFAIAYDAQSSTSNGAASSGSTTHTVTGSNPVLMGGTSSRGTNSTFTYNGVAFTARSSVSNIDTAKLFSNTSPATGANTLSASFSANNWSAGAVSFSGASGSFGTDVTYVSGSTSNVTLNITAASTSFAVDIMMHGQGGSAPTATGANTRRWGIGTATVDSGGMSTAPGTGSSMTMSWNPGGTSVGGSVACEVLAASGGGVFLPKIIQS